MAGMVRRFLDLRSPDDDPVAELTRLCEACVAELPVTTASVSRIRDDEHHGSVASAGPHADALGTLQQEVADGPALEAHGTRASVSEPDLPHSDRWPRYRSDAVAAGVAACFSFPLQIGVARFGTLDLVATDPGPLSAEDRTEALLAADVASSLLLGLTAGGRPIGLPTSIDLLTPRPIVHQAAGMASVQLDTSIEDAYVALQTRARNDHVTLDRLAQELVAHEVSLVGGPGKEWGRPMGNPGR